MRDMMKEAAMDYKQDPVLAAACHTEVGHSTLKRYLVTITQYCGFQNKVKKRRDDTQKKRNFTKFTFNKNPAICDYAGQSTTICFLITVVTLALPMPVLALLLLPVILVQFT